MTWLDINQMIKKKQKGWVSQFMKKDNNKPITTQIAELTFQLLNKCQEKEMLFAQKFGISLAGFRCLRHLHEHQQAIVKQLAESMNLTSSRLTRIIDDLISKDLVIRESKPFDRRAYIISLTKKGKELAKKLYGNFNTLHEVIFSEISDSNQKTITKSLRQMLDSLDLWFKKDELEKWKFLKAQK